MDIKTNSDSIWFEHIHIILNKNVDTKEEAKVIEIWQDFEFEAPLTFGDILEKAKAMGYKRGCILLICESFLSGKIYRYGNYKDDIHWVKVGEMKGFA